MVVVKDQHELMAFSDNLSGILDENLGDKLGDNQCRLLGK
jgi:hypothetical protein